ncbi:MAG: carbon-nitrogen hydrolase family protein [Lentisphaerae bacterium]|nr:carbon-nitrogen hydrolase family protein [Lentisphaerota bacterium]
MRVVSLTEDGYFGMRIPPDELLDLMVERLEFASSYHPDIACLPECFAWGRDPEPVPGPLTQRLAVWAREQSCYVICPMRISEGRYIYNAAVLLDRGGGTAGIYRKIRVTENGIRKGESPGPQDPPVFATDFGTIGIQICWDAAWPQGWDRLGAKGAEIVFFPAAYPARRMIAAHAWRNEYYVVSSTLTRPAAILDITGEEISRSQSFRPWAEATLWLGKRLFEIDGGNADKMWEVKRKYGDRVEICWYDDEDWITLASRDPEHISVAEIVREFDLLPIREYHGRAEKAQLRAWAAVAARPLPCLKTETKSPTGES